MKSQDAASTRAVFAKSWQWRILFEALWHRQHPLDVASVLEGTCPITATRTTMLLVPESSWAWWH